MCKSAFHFHSLCNANLRLITMNLCMVYFFYRTNRQNSRYFHEIDSDDLTYEPIWILVYLNPFNRAFGNCVEEGAAILFVQNSVIKNNHYPFISFCSD